MARIITKELAKVIARKLGAEILKEKGAPHDTAVIYHNGVIIATFGIRHGSDKDSGHDHIPRQIFVGPGFAKLIGQCPKDRDDWIEKLLEIGKIETADPEAH